MAVRAAAQSRRDIGCRLVGRGYDGEPKLPKRTIGGGLPKGRDVVLGHRLEPDVAPFEGDRNRIDHSSLPGFHSDIIRVLIRYQGADNMSKDFREGLPRLPVVGEARRGPEGYLTYLLRQANASVRLVLDRALATEGMSAADLARLTMLTPQTVNGIVRALEMRGAVRKEADRINRRILRLIITEEGRALNKRCRALTAPIEAALNAKMPTDAQGAIRQWLVDVAKMSLE